MSTAPAPLDCYTGGAKVADLQTCCTGPHTTYNTFSQATLGTKRPAIATQLWANITAQIMASCDVDDGATTLAVERCFDGRVDGSQGAWLQCFAHGKSGARRGRVGWGVLVVGVLVGVGVVL